VAIAGCFALLPPAPAAFAVAAPVLQPLSVLRQD
jgi:hypothetical protein